jgi:hypothetical protein
MNARRRLTLLFLLLSLLAACGRQAQPTVVPAQMATTPTVQPVPATAEPSAARPTALPPTPAPTQGPTPTPPPAGELQLLPGEPLPPADVLDVVLARVDAGDMTLEEGLIAGLMLYAGESGALGLPAVQLPEADEGNRLLGRARDYLAHGTDPAARFELQRLLAAIAPSTEALLRYAAPEPPGGSPAVARGHNRPARAAGPVQCRQLWLAGFPAGQRAACFQYSSVPLSGGEGRVFYPAEWWPADARLEFARGAAQALADSDRVFSAWGAVRSIDLVFTVLGDSRGSNVLAMVPTWDRDANCQVIIYPSALDRGLAVFQQTVAHEVFHCFQLWNFPGHTAEGYRSGGEWWVEGSAEYFSNVVYPATNDEWRRVELFDRRSATLPLHRLSYDATVFFQYLGNTIGDAAVIELFKTFPAANSAQAGADLLAALPGMQSTFHGFAQAWADRAIADTGGGFLPTTVYIDPLNQNLIDTDLWFSVEAPPFLLQRYLLAFAPQNWYEVATRYEGASGLASARFWDSPGRWGELPVEVRLGCETQLVYFYVLTSATSGAASSRGRLDAEAQDDPDCQPACDHPYMPLRPGASWSYASTDGRQYTYAVTSVTGDTEAGSARMTLTGPETFVEYEWRCSAEQGLLRYMLRDLPPDLPAMELSLVEGSGAHLPPYDRLATGYAWDSRVKLDAVTSDPAGGTGTGGFLYEDHYSVTGPITVTVTSEAVAGWQIERAGQRTTWFSFSGGDSLPIVRQVSETLVYARGVGLVQSGTGRLVSYTIP